MITLGLDVGSNSVGSAWIDTNRGHIDLGVSVFPAGVEQSPGKRGAPLNQHRREKRQLRRTIARRAERKRLLKKALIEAGLLPAEPLALEALLSEDPWQLRRKALHEALTPHQFGRVLLHLNQRRGASNIKDEAQPDEDSEGKKRSKTEKSGKDSEDGAAKAAFKRLREQLKGRTVGEFMADLMDERRVELENKPGTLINQPIRNRQYRASSEKHLYANRDLIHEEFVRIWEAQASFPGPLAALLTTDLRKLLDDPKGDSVWRCRGLLFGQRQQYWKTETLGRCDLEPTDEGCPHADMWAQQYRVVESVNNIRILERGCLPRSLTPDERDKVLAVLRKQKTATPATIRKAIGIDKKDVRNFFSLNIEADAERQLNTDWFYREIVHGIFGEKKWQDMDERGKQSVNRAILAFDPEQAKHEEKLRCGCTAWWNLADDAAEKLIAVWKKRPRLQNRLNLSRRAIRNLLPYMNCLKPDGSWPTQIEARSSFAEDGDAVDQTTGQEPTAEQRQRYSLQGRLPNRKQRQFQRKHPDLMPPAPMMANPVVRKAIHEVRRHVTAYIRKYGRKPDRVVIELVREARLSAKACDEQLARNRRRNKFRTDITEQFQLDTMTGNQQRKAEDRVILCRQQNGICPYCGGVISEEAAASGSGVEIDHIVPFSRSGDNSLNNRVLSHDHCNRGKGNMTPKEWLSDEAFAALESRLSHFEKPAHNDLTYFTKRDYARKWENLHRDACPEGEWRKSQLSDTAYTATQVGAYLSAALYPEVRDERKVFFTKGLYTAMLRGDWQLQDDKLGKNRDDHRHHAVDAAVIALTDSARLQELAARAAEWENAHSAGQKVRRPPVAPPAGWESVEAFRQEVMSRAEHLVVSHRPIRKLTGAIHMDNPYGPTSPDGRQYTFRKSAKTLLPKHVAISKAQREALEHGRRVHPADDPPIAGKSYLVRDCALRLQIRKCLRRNNLDPDTFTKKQIEALVDKGLLCMDSGVPIKSAVCLTTITSPVVFPGRIRDLEGHSRNDPNWRARRVYKGENNHHIEVRVNANGKWSGKVVTMAEAVRRVRQRKGQKALNAIDRSATKQGTFVMSLSIGEIIHMKHPQTGKSGYFTVFKIDNKASGVVHVVHHWDARPNEATADQQPREDVSKGIPVSKLKDLGPLDGVPPYKVRVGPLMDDVRRVDGD